MDGFQGKQRLINGRWFCGSIEGEKLKLKLVTLEIDSLTRINVIKYY